MWGQLSTTCSNVLKQPNGELIVAVNHNQLRTMASETVDPIDWSHPPPSWTVPPERHVHSINKCNLSGTRTCNRSMRDNHLAYAATQGIKPIYDTCALIFSSCSFFFSLSQTHHVAASLPSPGDNHQSMEGRSESIQSQAGRVKLFQLHMYHRSPFFPIFRSLSRSLHNHFSVA